VTLPEIKRNISQGYSSLVEFLPLPEIHEDMGLILSTATTTTTTKCGVNYINKHIIKAM
jgi:hypothetical protein